LEEAVTVELIALALKWDARKAKLAGKTLTVPKLEAPETTSGSADFLAQFIQKWESKFEKWDKVFKDIQDSRLPKEDSGTRKKNNMDCHDTDKGKEVQAVVQEPTKDKGIGKAQVEQAKSTSQSEEVATSIDRGSGSIESGFNEGSFFVGDTERVGVVEPDMTRGKKLVEGSKKKVVNDKEVLSHPTDKVDQGECPSTTNEPKQRAEARGSHAKHKAIREKVRVSRSLL
jgi:hypothetical protein